MAARSSDIAGEVIEPNWPKIQVLGSFRQFGALAYAWSRLIPAPQRVFFERPWMEGNITVDRGPLAGAYEPITGRSAQRETRLLSSTRSKLGCEASKIPAMAAGEGDSFRKGAGLTKVWKDAEDDGDLFKPIWRWAEAFQNDWAARSGWCVKPWREANHAPIVNLEGQRIQPRLRVRL